MLHQRLPRLCGRRPSLLLLPPAHDQRRPPRPGPRPPQRQTVHRRPPPRPGHRGGHPPTHARRGAPLVPLRAARHRPPRDRHRRPHGAGQRGGRRGRLQRLHGHPRPPGHHGDARHQDGRLPESPGARDRGGHHTEIISVERLHGLLLQGAAVPQISGAAELPPGGAADLEIHRRRHGVPAAPGAPRFAPADRAETRGPAASGGRAGAAGAELPSGTRDRARQKPFRLPALLRTVHGAGHRLRGERPGGLLRRRGPRPRGGRRPPERHGRLAQGGGAADPQTRPHQCQRTPPPAPPPERLPSLPRQRGRHRGPRPPPGPGPRPQLLPPAPLRGPRLAQPGGPQTRRRPPCGAGGGRRGRRHPPRARLPPHVRHHHGLRPRPAQQRGRPRSPRPGPGGGGPPRALPPPQTRRLRHPRPVPHRTLPRFLRGQLRGPHRVHGPAPVPAVPAARRAAAAVAPLDGLYRERGRHDLPAGHARSGARVPGAELRGGDPAAAGERTHARSGAEPGGAAQRRPAAVHAGGEAGVPAVRPWERAWSGCRACERAWSCRCTIVPAWSSRVSAAAHDSGETTKAAAVPSGRNTGSEGVPVGAPLLLPSPSRRPGSSGCRVCRED
mmetsp:Transcript_36673/g.72106  ORF Transcript_36673/g.72106 Transcript_36673/m.72106 type:complete len:613 (+) Transcript_36673:2128-3966(+)